MTITLTLDGTTHEIEIVRRRPQLVLRIGGREHTVGGAHGWAEGRHSIAIDGEPVAFIRARDGDRQFLRLGGRDFDARLVDPSAAAAAAGDGQDTVRAPMPGAVVAVHAKAGDIVGRGDKLVTIESMKLQMALAAPRDGVVALVRRRDGEVFEKDEVIVMLEPAARDG